MTVHGVRLVTWAAAMIEDKKEALADALRHHANWGDAYLVEMERRLATETELEKVRGEAAHIAEQALRDATALRSELQRVQDEYEKAFDLWRKENAKLIAKRQHIDRMVELIYEAVDELGVPDEGYPAPVANAVSKLQAALAVAAVRRK